MSEKTMSDEYKTCAVISTKRMFLMVLMAQQVVLQNTVDKKQLMNILSTVEHDILLLNDGENSVHRDLLE